MSADVQITLSVVEQARLHHKERLIERGVQQVGEALRDIRDERLYRDLDRLAEPISEPHGSAIHAVRGRLHEVQRHRQTFPTRNHLYLLLKGWNYYATGKAVQRLQMAPKAGTQFRLPNIAKWAPEPK